MARVKHVVVLATRVLHKEHTHVSQCIKHVAEVVDDVKPASGEEDEKLQINVMKSVTNVFGGDEDRLKCFNKIIIFKLS